MDCQHHNQNQKGAHHVLADLLQTVLQPSGADQEAQHYGNHHENTHFHGIRQHGAEDAFRSGGFHAMVEGAGGELVQK